MRIGSIIVGPFNFDFLGMKPLHSDVAKFIPSLEVRGFLWLICNRLIRTELGVYLNRSSIDPDGRRVRPTIRPGSLRRPTITSRFARALLACSTPWHRE